MNDIVVSAKPISGGLAKESEVRNVVAEHASYSLQEAGHTFDFVRRHIESLQARLDPNQEIGVIQVNGAASQPIHVLTIGFRNPDILIFEGIGPDRSPIISIQHVTQLNVQFVVVPKIDEKPIKIGFMADQ